MNITIFVEDSRADTEKNVLAVYPGGIADELASLFPDDKVRTVSLRDPECGLSEETLADTDVLFWWGHRRHGDVPDEVVRRVVTAVQCGMGFIALHSAHMSKPFAALTGTSCTLRWRDDDYERVWIADPSHPIAAGVPETFALGTEEMYGEPFDIPNPDRVVAIGWFRGGEVFRSVCTFQRGLGRIAYFQPGHETCASYKNENIRLMLKNAARWAKPSVRRTPPIVCLHPQPAENQNR